MASSKLIIRVLILACLFFGTYRVQARSPVRMPDKMEENCVLSFVVPRDKMKSSCDVEDKIKRRINAVEVKVDVYRQQIQDLQTQLSKERKLNADKIERLENSRRRGPMSSDSGVLLERLTLLERDFGRLSNDVIQGRSLNGGNKNAAIDDHDPNFNAIDKNPVTMPNLVKSMVEAELQTALVDVTKRFETYVQEQILVYGKVFNIISKPRDEPNLRGEIRIAGKPTSNTNNDRTYNTDKQKEEFSDDLIIQLDKVKEDLDKSGEEIAKKVSDYLQKSGQTRYGEQSSAEIKTYNIFKTQTIRDQLLEMTTATDPTVAIATTDGEGVTSTNTVVNNTIDYEEFSLMNTSEITLNEDNGFEVNDSFSGDNPDNNETSSKPALTSRKVNTEISGSASSRISSHKAGKNNGTETISEYHKDMRWKENMVKDQEYEKTQAEENLMAKVTSLLYQPLAKIMNLVDKQNIRVTDQLKKQKESTQKMSISINNRMKALDRAIETNGRQLESISLVVQDLPLKMDKLKFLEASVKELKENSSTHQSHMPIAFDERGKRLKKLERLMGVYQQSLEHYKNETKTEYKQLRDMLMKEAHNFKIVSKTLKKNITETVVKDIKRFNDTQSMQLKEIDQQISDLKEHDLLCDIDLNNLSRRLNSKNSRVEREIADIRGNVDHFSGKSRDYKKKIDLLNRKYSSLETKVNSTAKIIEDLKIEVKLTMTDNWLPIDFVFDGSRSDCFGKQYLRRSKFRNATFVGVVLCNPERYKIFLGDSLEKKFRHIGDGNGFGEDHCEFVGASKKNKITLAPFEPLYVTDKGWTREFWGEEPQNTVINAMKPSPKWYECGVTIP